MTEVESTGEARRNRGLTNKGKGFKAARVDPPALPPLEISSERIEIMPTDPNIIKQRLRRLVNRLHKAHRHLPDWAIIARSCNETILILEEMKKRDAVHAKKLSRFRPPRRGLEDWTWNELAEYGIKTLGIEGIQRDLSRDKLLSRVKTEAESQRIDISNLFHRP